MTPAELVIIKTQFRTRPAVVRTVLEVAWQPDSGQSRDLLRAIPPCDDVIVERIPNTFQLVVVAMVIALVIAVTVGILSAVWKYSIFDHTVNDVLFFGLAMPVFWFGLMLQLLFAVELGWLPSADMGTRRIAHASAASHLPALALAFGTVAGWSRYVRSSMLEVINYDYMRTARAKGVPPWRSILRHALKNALIPFVTVVMLDIPQYLTGAVIVETIFDWPGLGRLFFDSLGSRDYPVLMGS